MKNESGEPEVVSTGISIWGLLVGFGLAMVMLKWAGLAITWSLISHYFIILACVICAVFLLTAIIGGIIAMMTGQGE